MPGLLIGYPRVSRAGQNPMQQQIDHALGRVPERHQPFVARRAVSSRFAARCGSGYRCGCRHTIDTQLAEGGARIADDSASSRGDND